MTGWRVSSAAFLWWLVDKIHHDVPTTETLNDWFSSQRKRVMIAEAEKKQWVQLFQFVREQFPHGSEQLIKKMIGEIDG